jgi:hypothetical protein
VASEGGWITSPVELAKILAKEEDWGYVPRRIKRIELTLNTSCFLITLLSLKVETELPSRRVNTEETETEQRILQIGTRPYGTILKFYCRVLQGSMGVVARSKF